VTPADLVVGAQGARFMGRVFPCALGRAGAGEKRREGDAVTPAGIHRIEAVFCRADRMHNPCTIHARGRCMNICEHRLIGPRDGWSDDPRDPAYNALVRRPHRFGHEALRRADPMYDLVAVLGWNRHPPVCGTLPTALLMK